jgi:lysophospholipase L1-like esterase
MGQRRAALALGAVVLLVGAAAVGEPSKPALRLSDATRAGASAGGVSIWPNPVRSGRPALIVLADRRARTAAGLVECLFPPGGRERCRSVARRVRAGGRGVAVGVRARRQGVWQVEVRAAGPYPVPPGAFDVRRTVRVVGGRVRLLATGDSEIQGIDEDLAAGLPSVGVTSEAHISTGISKPQMFDWVARAAVQARSLHPDVTAVYIGANDGFALPAASGRLVLCCGPAWVEAFARRTRSMMASYARGGAGRVYWFTLPAPRDGAAAGVFRAINRAYLEAAAALPDLVRILDIRPVFTPGGTYRDSMYYQGRYVTVREPDGYHLSSGGNQIATSILIGAMRADGLLG